MYNLTLSPRFIKENNEKSVGIIRSLCERVLNQLNELESKENLSIFPEEYPDSFNFLDKLSIECQTKYYDEICPGLGDTINNYLEDEYNNLSNEEQFIIDYSEYFEPDSNGAMKKIERVFAELWNEHYESQKIQDYISMH